MNVDEATAHAYALFSRLLLSPLDRDSVSAFGAIDTPLDELAAAQHALLSFDVPPYAGFFLDPDGLVGGADATALVEAYRSRGFYASRQDASADHLGVTLGALAFLTRRGDREGVRMLLDDHVLRWFPAFVAAATRNASGFWLQVVELLSALVWDHRDRLGPSSAEPLALPEATPLIADARTGLRDIARHLCTPLASGTCITRRDIRELGRSLDVPQGFGSRTNMLENVLRAAGEYDRFPEAVARLHELLERHAEELAVVRNGLPWAERGRAMGAQLLSCADLAVSAKAS